MERDINKLIKVPGLMTSAAVDHIVVSTQDIYDYKSLKYQAEINEEVSRINETVESCISKLIDLAPEALDTLKEIADAINNDPNFYLSLTTIILEKYTKPASGIPKSDLDSSVLSSLNNADTALQTEQDPIFSSSPAAGITNSDISNWNNKATLSDVSTALANLVNQAPTTLDTLNELAAALGNDPNFATTIANQIGAKYTKPSGGIPKTDLDSNVQASLTLANSALQSAPVTSVNGMTGAVVIPEGGVTSFNGQTGAITYNAPVTSVNGQTGAVTINTVESDPIFSASVAAGISNSDISNWNSKSNSIPIIDLTVEE